MATRHLEVYTDDGAVMYKCPSCNDQFARKDNLRRHLRSHATPRFQCDQSDCGMRFHRLDVLKRHKLVHEPCQSKKRRKPRRGVFPESYIQRRSVAAAPSQPGSPADLPLNLPSGGSQTTMSPANQESEACSTVVDSSPEFSTPSLDQDFDATSVESQDVSAKIDPDNCVLLFCLSHFSLTCIKRYPFIHHTTIFNPHLPKGMTLAIAAVAGMGFEIYKHQCRHFFEEARRLAMPAISTSYRELSASDISWRTTKLLDLQLQVLLLEYAIWSKESELESWAFRHISLLFELVFRSSERLPAAIVENVEPNAPNKTRLDLQPTGEILPTWASWVYDEELKRTIFALYCLSIKASRFLGHEVYVPIEVEVLRMPASDDLFNASMEADWEQSRKRESRKPDQISLKVALLTITYLRPDYEETCASLSPSGRHILLCGITVKVMEAARQPLLYNSFDAYVASDLPALRLKDDFLKALRTFHRLLRPNPACLWIYAPCNTMDIQSLLLVCHLEISFLYSTAEDVSEYISDDLRSAFVVALQPFSDISKHGYIEIATQGPWRLDKASCHATRIVTQVIMKWITKVCALASKGRVEEADKGLYLQLTRLVTESPGFNNTADLDINYNPATVARTRSVLDEMMPLILS